MMRCLLFGSHTANVLSEAHLVHVSHIFLLVTLLLKMVPKCGTEVLFSAPTYKKALLLLTEKINVVDKLHLGMSYSAIDCEFNVNQQSILNLY